MKNNVKHTIWVCLLSVLLVVAFSTRGFAQDDNTGTNPVNFTYDARFITRSASLFGTPRLFGGSATAALLAPSWWQGVLRCGGNASFLAAAPTGYRP